MVMAIIISMRRLSFEWLGRQNGAALRRQLLGKSPDSAFDTVGRHQSRLQTEAGPLVDHLPHYSGASCRPNPRLEICFASHPAPLQNIGYVKVLATLVACDSERECTPSHVCRNRQTMGAPTTSKLHECRLTIPG